MSSKDRSQRLFDAWWQNHGQRLARPIDGLVDVDQLEAVARASWNAAWRSLQTTNKPLPRGPTAR